MYLGAHILLPEGWETHLNVKYPLAIYHGHFPDDFGGWRTTPPDENLVPDTVKRFNLIGYNKIVQQEAYDFYKMCWSLITENRKKSNSYKNPNDRNTVSYLLVCMFKILAIQTASQRNDFGSYHYFWMDFGCSHVAKNNMYEASIKMLENPNPKISVLYINYRSKKTLEDMENVVNSGTCGMAGTVFSAEKTYIAKFCSYMWSMFYEMIGRGVGHTDEQVFTYCYDRHPELFTIYFGDYYSVIKNYHYVCQDWHTIRWCFIQQAQNANRHDLAQAAAKSILEGFEKKQSDFPESEIEFMKSIAYPSS
jgi:hypothetical protein